MLINGETPSVTGVVVGRLDDALSIVVKGHKLKLEFSQDGDMPRSHVTNDGVMHLVNFDRPVGSFAKIDGNVDGEEIRGTIVVHLVGEEGLGVRIVHYTFL